MGDEGYGPQTIRITAVGESSILAVLHESDGKPVLWCEQMWHLSGRDWKVKV